MYTKYTKKILSILVITSFVSVPVFSMNKDFVELTRNKENQDLVIKRIKRFVHGFNSEHKRKIDEIKKNVKVTVYETRGDLVENALIIVVCRKITSSFPYKKIIFSKDDKTFLHFDKGKHNEFFAGICKDIVKKSEDGSSRRIRIAYIEIKPFETKGGIGNFVRSYVGCNGPGIKPDITGELVDKLESYLEVMGLVYGNGKLKKKEIEKYDDINKRLHFVKIVFSGSDYSDVVKHFSNEMFASIGCAILFDPKERTKIPFIPGFLRSKFDSLKSWNEKFKFGENCKKFIVLKRPKEKEGSKLLVDPKEQYEFDVSGSESDDNDSGEEETKIVKVTTPSPNSTNVVKGSIKKIFERQV